MTILTGYLLIADISGYTKFLTSSELDHADPILQSLLSALIEQVGDPLNLWKMEGDAVLAYSTRQEFPSGETFLAICENLYNAFADRRLDIIANTTCTCRACANVGTLDLKIIAHYGQFDEMTVGPLTDISGADVILVHRMTKTDVKQITGIRSYALFSDAAAQAMDITEALEPFSQSFEYFGEVSMQVYDLAKAWETARSGRERFFLEEEDGVWTVRHHFNAPAGVVWETLVAPEHKERWMDSVKAVSVDNTQGRIGKDSRYHCAHEAADFFYKITDWEPFIYFSTRITDPGRPEITTPETYHLTQTDTGTELRYTMGQATDAEGNRCEVSEQEAVAFRSEFWRASFDEMEAQIDASQ
jgi:uncharacterized protein YndB with AHSA1/START domain